MGKDGTVIIEKKNNYFIGRVNIKRRIDWINASFYLNLNYHRNVPMLSDRFLMQNNACRQTSLYTSTKYQE